MPRNIRYTNHALEKMRQREISRRQVEQTIRQPELTTQGYNNRIIVEKKSGKLNLRVVHP